MIFILYPEEELKIRVICWYLEWCEWINCNLCHNLGNFNLIGNLKSNIACPPIKKVTVLCSKSEKYFQICLINFCDVTWSPIEVSLRWNWLMIDFAKKRLHVKIAHMSLQSFELGNKEFGTLKGQWYLCEKLKIITK